MRKIVELEEDDIRKIIAKFYDISEDNVGISVDDNLPFTMIVAKVLLEVGDL